MIDSRYRQGANAIIINPKGYVLIVQKVKYKDTEWEFPGGGLDTNEKAAEGVLRELKEELGDLKYEIISQSNIVQTFDWPEDSIEKAYKKYGVRWSGQQKVIFFIWLDETNPNILLQKEEIRTYKWAKYSELKDHLIFDGQMDKTTEIVVNEVQQLLTMGWQAREALDFSKAYGLLNFSRDVYESLEDWYNVTECLNHLAYTHKLEAIQHNNQGSTMALEALHIARTKNTKLPSVYRALMSLSSAAGNYEEALKYGKLCLEATNKPLPKSDVLSHLATFNLRTGKLSEATSLLEESEALFNEHSNSEDEPHKSIWYTRILIIKALILYNGGEVVKAKDVLSQALNIAQDKKLKTRELEITNLLKLF